MDYWDSGRLADVAEAIRNQMGFFTYGKGKNHGRVMVFHQVVLQGN
jgi:hypothetical protein